MTSPWGTPWQLWLHKAEVVLSHCWSLLTTPAQQLCCALLLCALLLAGRSEKRDARPTGTLLPAAAAEEPVPERLWLGGGWGSAASAGPERGLGETSAYRYDLCLMVSALLDPAKAARAMARLGMPPLALRGTREVGFSAWRSRPKAQDYNIKGGLQSQIW